MRNGLLIIFVLCLYFHFQSRKDKIVEEDSINLKQSAVRSPDLAPKRSLQNIQDSQPATHLVESSQENIALNENELINESDLSEEDESYDEDVTQLPWEDIEAGWKTHLKEFLVGIDPEKADEMFTAYLEEKKKYLEKVEFSDKGISGHGDLSDSESELTEFDQSHKENLREIFGDYYSQVESIHKDYVDSVQYLNRSQAKFSISL
jgi:hypothetical protein